MNNLYFLFILFLLSLHLQGQDHRFNHFYNGESDFNPALVGIHGAFSLTAKTRQQWQSNETVPFRTAYVSMEESMLCNLFDYGFFGKASEEGDGFYRTYEFGSRLAFSAPMEWNEVDVNLRIGGGVMWGQHTIDYNRLIFSDELDPKYGLVDELGIDLPTAFVAPESNRSAWYFSPGIGVAGMVILPQPFLANDIALSFGSSIHHFINNPTKGLFGNHHALLGSGAVLPQRFNVYAKADLPFAFDQSYVNLTPLFVYQRQTYQGAALSYTELGVSGSLSRTVGAGIHYHSANSSFAGTDTHWLSYQFEFGILLKSSQLTKQEWARNRLDIGLAYAHNISGIQNTVGPTFEVTLSWHFMSSPACAIFGGDFKYNLNQHGGCPTISKSNRKLYENIWFKSNQ